MFTVTHSNEMEEPVNRWLHENESIEIHHVRQSESMNNESWSMTLTLFYSQGDRKIGFDGAQGFETGPDPKIDRQIDSNTRNLPRNPVFHPETT